MVTSATDIPDSLSIESVEEDAVMKNVALSVQGFFTPIGTSRTTKGFVLMNPQRVPYTEAMLKLMPESMVHEESARGKIWLTSKSTVPAAKPLPNPMEA